MNPLDPMLPFAPARVRALLLPLGPIRSERFAAFVERLKTEIIVPLRDVTADARPNRNMFSPLAYPDGAIFYDLVTYMPPASHLALSPFDMYREPLAILAIADGAELTKSTYNKSMPTAGTATATTSLAEKNIRALYQELEGLRDQHHKALVHQIVLFDYNDPPEKTIPMPEGIVPVPTLEKSTRTTLKTVMCDMSSTLLAEMNTLAKSIEGLGYVDSPGQLIANAPRGRPTLVDEGRRNSQFSATTRSSAAADARSLSRMSMPPLRHTLSNIARSPRRPSTPATGADSTIIESDIPESGRSTPDIGGPGSRTATPDGFRSPPLERITMQGFGSGGINEKLRQKGKSRVQIVVGSLYLQCGRWPDALKELAEGASAARSMNDHVWHGKALELIVCCLYALGWSGLEFSVPAVCTATLDRAIPEAKPDPNDPDQPRHTRVFQAMLPDLMDRILGLYSRITGEKLPQLPMCEAIIRTCKMMTALHCTDGILNKACFDIIVEGKWPAKQLTTSPRFTITPTRHTIVNLLFRAFPASSTELLTVVDRAAILSGICFVLGKIGFQRKKTMVTRELMSVLISGLVEARTRGAADVGIHPAAGLVSLTGPGAHTKGATLELQEEDVEQGIGNLLDVICRNYGVVDFDMPVEMGRPNRSAEETPDEIVARVRRQSAARLYGFPTVKLNILRACINFCEALPDFQGVLKYSSDLLRTAGSGVAPGPRGDDASPMIPREEQMRLLTNISKTHDLSQRLGMAGLTGEYWDEFLVRGISLEPLPETKTPIQHPKSIIPGATISRASQDVNPFIYNPFLKKDEKQAHQTLVAMEPATFKITLQNPYDIEVDIQSIQVVGEGIKFESYKEHVIVGAYRTHVVRIVGVPQEGGTLRITGARVKVRGCRERVFPIFHDRWAPAPEAKIKAIGMRALQHSIDTESRGSPPLAPNALELKVINEQPLVVVKSTTLPQSSVMILEGERQRFRVTLQNTSTTAAVDFILFSFDDSTQGPLRTALQNRDSTPSELYEYELILMKKQVLRIHKRPNDKRYIAPGSTVMYEFEILGKPGLTSASIQIDYAHLGGSPDDIGPQFHTRRISLPITVTVNGSVEIARCDIVPLFGHIPAPFWDHVRKLQSARSSEEGLELDTDQVTPENYCLMSLDLRNIWPSNIQVTLSTGDVAVDEFVLPGNTTRVVVPLRRIYLDDPHAAIPVLNPNRNRQFVVSTSKVAPDFERNVRESFWYRERILDTLMATWKTTSGPKHSGTVELRSIRLTSRMIEAVKIEDVGIDVRLEDVQGRDTGRSMTVDSFSQIRVRVTNRSAQPIFPLLRLMPALCHRPANMAMESTRKFAWNGTLQQRLPLLDAKSSTDVVVGFTALCRGEFEITASIEEAMLFESEKDKAEREHKKRTRQRADTAALIETAMALGIRERRIWHTRQPCTFPIACIHSPHILSYSLNSRLCGLLSLKMGRRILFLDAYDSFTNNIVAMLQRLPGVTVDVLKIDAPGLFCNNTGNVSKFVREIAPYDGIICGPGPGNPENHLDVGLMNTLWLISDNDAKHVRPRMCPPVLGICLGFQSMARHFGGEVRQLRRGLHGMVRPVLHVGLAGSETMVDEVDNIFADVEPFNATLYHSLCISLDQDEVARCQLPQRMWQPFKKAPDLIPLAWHVNTDVVSGYEDKGLECILMAFKHQHRPLWGLQYHPESACTEPQAVKVIENWLKAADWWNSEFRTPKPNVPKPIYVSGSQHPSHMSALAQYRNARGLPGFKPAEIMYGKLEWHRLPLPEGIEVPDLLEILQVPTGDQIVLDSSNHNLNLPPKTADVRGSHSIIALDVENALRIEYRTGSKHAVLSHPPASPGGLRNKESVQFGTRYADIWQFLAEFMALRKMDRPSIPDLSPFIGGFMGYVTYEMGLENIQASVDLKERQHERPDLCFVWVTKSLVINHRKGFMDVQRLWYNSSKSTSQLHSDSFDEMRIQSDCHEEGEDWVSITAKKLYKSALWKSQQASTAAPSTDSATPACTPAGAAIDCPIVTAPESKNYWADVLRCQWYIANGESYELCLTDQTTIRLPLRPDESPDMRRWTMFRNLRRRQPAPFASYIRLGGATLVSASPERFLNTLPSGLCTMRPMKGTVRKSPQITTMQQAEKLLHVPKEIAENLMIVDLVRHDLQGICAPGAVKPTHLMKVEEYATVFTMVTIIEAQLSPEYTGLDALAASFPPGSMTGAPKKRSCEILTKIEDGKERSLYSGVVGYIDATGQADWSVTIRSLFSWDDETYMDKDTGKTTEVWRVGAGGAVTALSTPEGEADEMFLKLAGPLSVLETMEF
ncbi:hypothetical protein TD95_001291 [Thielaviopsis punctulata]|uniref:p-aminobenzoic acid synthase n=1 Tax=Thielaviopsis punctulata TaxID=72032 RepID=A0A0F4ZD06_9PEZI|nr:hypothetical protein TD95_001291 [Thielaviopsis punctulata]